MSLKGKTALVTGSTSGIGLGIAQSLARSGADLILNGFGDASKVIAEIEQFGGKVGHHPADVSDPAQIADMISYAEREFGGIDILVNFVQINDFAGAEERSWQARYDFDFAKLGIPGLSFMSRYLSGDNIKLKNGETGKEWERNSEIKYVVQTGTFKDVAVRLRNATYRSNYSARDADEMRVLVSYSVALW